MNNDFIKRVIILDIAELMLKKKKLTKKQFKILRRGLNKCWIHIWDFEYSDEENKEFYSFFPEEDLKEVQNDN